MRVIINVVGGKSDGQPGSCAGSKRILTARIKDAKEENFSPQSVIKENLSEKDEEGNHESILSRNILRCEEDLEAAPDKSFCPEEKGPPLDAFSGAVPASVDNVNAIHSPFSPHTQEEREDASSLLWEAALTHTAVISLNESSIRSTSAHSSANSVPLDGLDGESSNTHTCSPSNLEGAPTLLEASKELKVKPKVEISSDPPPQLKEDDQQSTSCLPSPSSNSASTAGSGRKRPRSNVAPSIKSDVSASISAEAVFLRSLRAKGWELKVEEGDGNCLFRAVSTHIYGDAGMHTEIRHKCTAFMERESSHYSRFIVGDFNTYINKLKLDGVHGSNLEIQCMTELFNRPIEIYVPERGAVPINIFHGTYKTTDAPMRLSYHGGNHYNSIVDPKEATVGLGLGIPTMLPDAAERELLERTLYSSQLEQLDQAMRNKILTISDWEETERELEEMAIAASLNACKSTSAASQFYGANISNSKYPGGSSNTKGSEGPKLKREDGHQSGSAQARPNKKTRTAGGSPPTSPLVSRDSELYINPLDYPEAVQEMLLNGFPLKRVLYAYEMVGDSTDDLLMLLLSSPMESPSR